MRIIVNDVIKMSKYVEHTGILPRHWVGISNFAAALWEDSVIEASVGAAPAISVWHVVSKESSVMPAGMAGTMIAGTAFMVL